MCLFSLMPHVFSQDRLLSVHWASCVCVCGSASGVCRGHVCTGAACVVCWYIVMGVGCVAACDVLVVFLHHKCMSS